MFFVKTGLFFRGGSGPHCDSADDYGTGECIWDFIPYCGGRPDIRTYIEVYVHFDK